MPTFLSTLVLLLQKKALPHIVMPTLHVNCYGHFREELLDHPPYNPDLVLSDFHPFSNTEEAPGWYGIHKILKS